MDSFRLADVVADSIVIDVREAMIADDPPVVTGVIDHAREATTVEADPAQIPVAEIDAVAAILAHDRAPRNPNGIHPQSHSV